MDFRIEFSIKDTEFNKSFNIVAKDEAEAWTWSEKQKEVWKQNTSYDIKKMKVKVTDIAVELAEKAKAEKAEKKEEKKATKAKKAKKEVAA